MDALQPLGTQGWRSEKKVSPPIFKGLPGEKPDLHLLKTKDLLRYNRTPDHQKSHNFQYTVDNIARECYDDITVPTS